MKRTVRKWGNGVLIAEERESPKKKRRMKWMNLVGEAVVGIALVWGAVLAAGWLPYLLQ